MIIDENVKGYILSLEEDDSEILESIRREGLADEVPIIKRDGAGFLKFAVKCFKPKKILEVGTAIGYSALLMASVSDACITTVELDETRADKAEENIKKAGESSRITVLRGDAAVVLAELAKSGETYDMVFLDAAKAQYSAYYKEIRKMVKPGSIMLVDNVLQDGSAAGSKFAVKRRDRTIHIRMREFIESLNKEEGVSSVIIPLGDGLMLCSFE